MKSFTATIVLGIATHTVAAFGSAPKFLTDLLPSDDEIRQMVAGLSVESSDDTAHHRRLGSSNKYAYVQFYEDSCSRARQEALVHVEECTTSTSSGGSDVALWYRATATNEVSLDVWLGTTQCSGTPLSTTLSFSPTCNWHTNATATTSYSVKGTDVLYDLYTDDKCTVSQYSADVNDLNKLMDGMLEGGTSTCQKHEVGSGSLKVSADDTGVTLAQYASEDCSGTQVASKKILPGECTFVSSAISGSKDNVYVYLGGSEGACEIGQFKYCPPSSASLPSINIVTFMFMMILTITQLGFN
jgi:hypothetical protein